MRMTDPLSDIMSQGRSSLTRADTIRVLIGKAGLQYFVRNRTYIRFILQFLNTYDILGTRKKVFIISMKIYYHMVEDMYIRSSTISSGVPNTGGKY